MLRSFPLFGNQTESGEQRRVSPSTKWRAAFFASSAAAVLLLPAATNDGEISESLHGDEPKNAQEVEQDIELLNTGPIQIGKYTFEWTKTEDGLLLRIANEEREKTVEFPEVIRVPLSNFKPTEWVSSVSTFGKRSNIQHVDIRADFTINVALTGETVEGPVIIRLSRKELMSLAKSVLSDDPSLAIGYKIQKRARITKTTPLGEMMRKVASDFRKQYEQVNEESAKHSLKIQTAKAN